MSGCGCGIEQAESLERNTLKLLLLINAVMFLFELMLGLYAQSTGLIADSLDMLADSMVYGISLYAVGKSIKKQTGAARLSGYFQIVLGTGVMFEVIRRFIVGSEPEGSIIISVAFVALVANVICMMLLAKHRGGGVHMRASWIFSTNDVIANLGVIISGILVIIFGSNIPDLVVGSVIAVLVVRGGVKILREANTNEISEQHP